MKQFYTGTFTFEDGTCSTAQRPHSDYKHDDVVIEVPGNFLVHDRSEVSGYVSGIGNTVVIHIKEPFNTPEHIDCVKEVFGLKENSGLQVNVITFSDEDVEFSIMELVDERVAEQNNDSENK